MPLPQGTSEVVMPPVTFPLKFKNAPENFRSDKLVSVPYTLAKYSAANGRKPQPVLAERNVFAPSINLNEYNCTAVVDWLEVALETPANHQAVNIHRYLSSELKDLGSASSVHVSGTEREVGYKGRQFLIRLQQPRLRTAVLLFAKAVRKYSVNVAHVGFLKVRGIEVSIDLKARANQNLSSGERNLKRWQIQDLLWRHLRVEPHFTERENCSPRFVQVRYSASGLKRIGASFVVRQTSPKPGSAISMAGLDEHCASSLMLTAYHQPLLDMTYYVGSNQSGVLLRIMDKCSDGRDPSKNTRVALPEEDWRARIEVSLLAEDKTIGVPAALGVDTLKDLIGFRFRDIRKPMFEFFVPTFNGNGTTAISELGTNVSEYEAFRRAGVYGLDRLHRSLHMTATQTDLLKDRHLHSHPLGKKGKLVSYVDLNSKLDRALKALEKHWTN